MESTAKLPRTDRALGLGRCSGKRCDGSRDAAGLLAGIDGDRNTVHLATLVFIFQMVYGIVSFGCMAFMWYVDSKDDAAEMEEDLEWTRAEEAEAHTWKGKLKAVG